MPRRHRRTRRKDRVEALAARLPEELRSFDGWLYSDAGQPTGLCDYMARLEAWIGEELGKPREVGAVLSVKVMEQHNLFVGDWYQLALTAEMEQARRRAVYPALQQ